MSVTNDFADAFQVSGGSPSGPAVGTFTLIATDLSLDDYSGGVFITDELPSTLALENFAGATITLSFEDFGTQAFASVEATVTTLELPEPAGAAPGGLALGMLACLTGRHARAVRGASWSVSRMRPGAR